MNNQEYPDTFDDVLRALIQEQDCINMLIDPYHEA